MGLVATDMLLGTDPVVIKALDAVGDVVVVVSCDASFRCSSCCFLSADILYRVRAEQ